MASQPSPAQAPAPQGRAGAALARRILKAGVLRLVGFVIARPRLDGFLRRQLFRFPGLAGRVRGAMARSRRSHWQTLPALPTEEAQLTDAARQVLHDLKRAIEHARQP